MDRFSAMQAFVRVVEAGSFTRAAETLQLGRTTVTQLVQQLEARLQVRLLNRTTRKVSVTADGAAYYTRVLQLLADLEEAEGALSSAIAQPRGRLRIDVPSPFARLVLVPALPDFHARYPDIRLDIGVSDREVDLIEENVDCVIRGGVLDTLSLVSRHIAELEIGFYAAPAYLARHGTPSHPLELQGPAQQMVGFLSPRSGKARTFKTWRGKEVQEVGTHHAVAIDDGNAYLAAGLAGLGVVCLPSYMAQPHLATAELQPLLPGWQLPTMPLYLLFPPNRHVSRRLRVFIDWVTMLLSGGMSGGSANRSACE